MIKNIHHINFLVTELNRGVERFEKLGLGPFHRDPLPNRGVETARAKVGATWLVLVQPTDPSGAPGRHLAEHGEGFFLLSFETDDLDQEKRRLSERGFRWAPEETRQGLLNWQVCDIDQRDTGGVLIQFTQDDDEHQQ